MNLRLRSGFCSHPACKEKGEQLFSNRSKMLCPRHNASRLAAGKTKTTAPLRRFLKKLIKSKRIITHTGKVKTERTKIIRQLDKIVSIYIRKRYPKCYTCNNYTEQCGHFCGRANMGTRYLLDALRGQCVPCNCYHHGRLDVFRKNLVLELGEARVLEIESLSKSSVKISLKELQETLASYETKLDNL